VIFIEIRLMARFAVRFRRVHQWGWVSFLCGRSVGRERLLQARAFGQAPSRLRPRYVADPMPSAAEYNKTASRSSFRTMDNSLGCGHVGGQGGEK
jgi:hypothetical protein